MSARFTSTRSPGLVRRRIRAAIDDAASFTQKVQPNRIASIGQNIATHREDVRQRQFASCPLGRLDSTVCIGDGLRTLSRSSPYGMSRAEPVIGAKP